MTSEAKILKAIRLSHVSLPLGPGCHVVRKPRAHGEATRRRVCHHLQRRTPLAFSAVTAEHGSERDSKMSPATARTRLRPQADPGQQPAWLLLRPAPQTGTLGTGVEG